MGIHDDVSNRVGKSVDAFKDSFTNTIPNRLNKIFSGQIKESDASRPQPFYIESDDNGEAVETAILPTYVSKDKLATELDSQTNAFKELSIEEKQEDGLNIKNKSLDLFDAVDLFSEEITQKTEDGLNLIKKSSELNSNMDSFVKASQEVKTIDGIGIISKKNEIDSQTTKHKNKVNQSPHSVIKFRDSITEYGVGSLSRFDVTFPQIPVKLLTQYPNIDRILQYRCDGTNLPSQTLDTQTTRVYGKPITLPTSRTFEEIRTDFLCSSDYRERKFIESWINLIVNPNTLDVSFQEKYIGTMQIRIFDNKVFYDGEMPPITYILEDCYPKSLEQQQLSWGSQSDVAKISVTWVTKQYYII